MQDIALTLERMKLCYPKDFNTSNTEKFLDNDCACENLLEKLKLLLFYQQEFVKQL